MRAIRWMRHFQTFINYKNTNSIRWILLICSLLFFRLFFRFFLKSFQFFCVCSFDCCSNRWLATFRNPSHISWWEKENKRSWNTLIQLFDKIAFFDAAATFVLTNNRELWVLYETHFVCQHFWADGSACRKKAQLFRHNKCFIWSLWNRLHLFTRI